MTLDSSVTPVVRPAWRVPAAMQDKVQQELNRMVQIGVITPCTEPTDWVSAMVTQLKKGTDLSDLNKALKRPHHPTKTVEEVAAKMDGATIFSVLDAKSSFWQVPLDHQLSMLTCFSTLAAFAFYACRMDFARRQMFSSTLWKLCLKVVRAPLLCTF